MKSILITISLLLVGFITKAQDTTLVILEKKVATFYYQEHIFAVHARERINTLEKRLEKEKPLTYLLDSLVALYRKDSILYQAQSQAYQQSLSIQSNIISDQDKVIRRERRKRKGLLLVSGLIMGIMILQQ